MKIVEAFFLGAVIGLVISLPIAVAYYYAMCWWLGV